MYSSGHSSNCDIWETKVNILGDFHCSHCRELREQVLPELKEIVKQQVILLQFTITKHYSKTCRPETQFHAFGSVLYWSYNCYCCGGQLPLPSNLDSSYYMRQIYVDTAILSITRALHLANVKYWFKNYRLHVLFGRPIVKKKRIPSDIFRSSSNLRHSHINKPHKASPESTSA